MAYLEIYEVPSEMRSRVELQKTIFPTAAIVLGDGRKVVVLCKREAYATVDILVQERVLSDIDALAIRNRIGNSDLVGDLPNDFIEWTHQKADGYEIVIEIEPGALSPPPQSLTEAMRN